jgi:hypothetical protein
LTFFVTGAFALALASPWASIIYDPNQWSWSYDTALPGSEYVQKVEEVVEVGGIPIAGVIYAVIFVLVLKAVSSRKKFIKKQN